MKSYVSIAKGTIVKRVAVGAAAAALVCAFGPTVAFAATGSNSGSYNELADAGLAGISTLSETQSSFDLRTNYVAPVKYQEPFGSCWAFACTSASEITIITELDWADNGSLDGSFNYTKASQSADGTLAKAASDLSERHLAWFGNWHLSETLTGLYASQAGEGLYINPNHTFSEECEATEDGKVMNVGGGAWLANVIYASGTGPVAESVAPYVNDEGEREQSGLPAATGTWKVDDSLRFQSVANIIESNILPSPKAANAAGVQAIKKELQEGHAVAIGYKADQSKPGQAGAGQYITDDNKYHYVYDDNTESDHEVCIVGWDDSIPASSFVHQYDGQTTPAPAGDGAWIVRNSWDSDWGDGGYFYMSYYDKSIDEAETYIFDVSNKYTQDKIDQYDFLESMVPNADASVSDYKMCNVFAGPDSGSEKLTSVGVQTGDANVTVTLAVYVMNKSDDAAAVIASSQPVATKTQSCEYAGFNRIALDAAVSVGSTQKYAVVQTNVKFDETQEIIYATNYDKEAAEEDTSLTLYAVAKVNPGESYVFMNGSWTDWSTTGIQLEDGTKLDEGEVYDNFGIKGYTVASTDPVVEKKAVYRLYNAATSEHLWTTDANEYNTLPAAGWTQENVTWQSPTTSATPVYRLYNPVLGTHHYTSDQAEIQALVSQHGWVYDHDSADGSHNAAFYSAAQSDASALPVMRMYNGGLSQHLLTPDQNEYGTLPGLGWNPEGVSFYAYAAN